MLIAGETAPDDSAGYAVTGPEPAFATKTSSWTVAPASTGGPNARTATPVIHCLAARRATIAPPLLRADRCDAARGEPIIHPLEEFLTRLVVQRGCVYRGRPDPRFREGPTDTARRPVPRCRTSSPPPPLGYLESTSESA